MTNNAAIAQLRTILDIERAWKEYYARLADRNGVRAFKKQSLRVAALEHAITTLGVAEMHERPRKVSSIEAERLNAARGNHITSKP